MFDRKQKKKHRGMAFVFCLLLSFSALAGKKFILVIDGGGMRGMIPATFLDQFCLETGKQPHEVFDLIVGTSIGGILSLAYALKVPTKTVIEVLFKKGGPSIFPPLSGKMLSSAFGLLDERYPAEGLENVLKELYQLARLKDAAVHVMVTASDIERDAPFLFKSWAAKADWKEDFLMWEVGRATSAAPTYFEPKLIQNAAERYALVDGGLCMNNPTMAAFAEGKRLWPKDELIILSLGTGDVRISYAYEKAKDWGIPSWIRPILHMTMDHVSKAVHYQAHEILHERSYYRFQPILSPEDEPMDDASPEHLQRLEHACLTAYGRFSKEIKKLKILLAAAGKL